jgi:hypothetical protein
MFTLEQESSIVDLAVIGSALYIWTENNIYVLQGSSYETYNLTRAIANLGCLADLNVATCGNLAYFWGSSTDLYMYDGNNYPSIINKPVMVNGNVSNGIYGSIANLGSTTHLTAINDKLYAYTNSDIEVAGSSSSVYQLYYYEFDLATRSWWKRAGFVSAAYASGDPTKFEPFYIANVAKDSIFPLYYEQVGVSVSNWYVKSYMGYAAEALSYVVTKAFNSGISEDETLTTLVIYARYDKEEGPR